MSLYWALQLFNLRNNITIEVPNQARHFGSYQESKLSVARRKGRYSAVKSSQHSWAGQYKKCVQYDFLFTSEYSDGSEKFKDLWKQEMLSNFPIICFKKTIWKYLVKIKRKLYKKCIFLNFLNISCSSYHNQACI